jgi:hypothetical protein
MRNTPEFAEYVKMARGERTQEQIDDLGGPVRQTQSRIENAEAFEITSGMLSMLDKAHDEAPGFFDAILRTGHPVPAKISELRYRNAQIIPVVGFVGYDVQSSQERELPRRLQMTTGRYGIFPLLGMLNNPGIGTVLVDTATLNGRVKGVSDLPDVFEAWRSRHPESTPWTTVPDLHLRYGFQPLIIDPLSAVTTLGQARDLVRRITGPTVDILTTDPEHLAVTAALTAYLARSLSITTYEVLDLFTETQGATAKTNMWVSPRNQPIKDAMDRFFSSAQLPATYRPVNPEIHRLMAGLQRLKAEFTHLDFTDPSAPPFGLCPPVTDFAALASSGPALVFYDGRKTREVPALIASGLANTAGGAPGELLIIAQHAVEGIAQQDGYLIVMRTKSLQRQCSDGGYAGLQVMAIASADTSEATSQLYRSFLGVLTSDDRRTAMPIFMPGE